MSEEINDAKKGSWLIQFGKGKENQMIIEKVFHRHDNGTIFSAYCKISDESSNIVMCKYACKSCKEETSLHAEYIYPAGNILSRAKTTEIKRGTCDPNK